jgi:hypothetical protein
MKRLLLLLSILVFALPNSVRADTLLERIATQILADRFGVDTRDILGLQRESREDIWDLGPVYSMSRYGNSPASEVQRLRASGMGWGNIAKKIGMHPGTFNKLRQQGYFDRDPFWDDIYRRRYGVRQSEIDGIRRRGARTEDVLGCIIVAKSSRKTPSDVYARYRQDKDWNRTAKRYNTDLNKWNSVGKKVGWHEEVGPPGKSPKTKPQIKSKKPHNVKSPGKPAPKEHGRPQGQGNKGGGKGKGKGKGG